MTLKTTKLRDAIAFALVVGATGFAGSAFAQETQPAQTTQQQPADQATELDTIVVTGTRIQSQTITASSPVAEIAQEEFQYTGTTRVEDLVNQYPQMAPAFDSFNNNPSLGYPTIDLRGLGAQRTLTLVNGFRLPPGAGELRDISIIPASIVRRVDLLTGGASAVYGSDAVAGVVNFVLDDEFEGVSLNVGYSAYQHENDNEYMQGLQEEAGFPFPTGDSGFDGASRNIDFAVGSSFADGRGHAMAWATYRENDPLFQSQRDYSSCALTASGTACGGSPTNAAGNFYISQILPDGPDEDLEPDFVGYQASLNGPRSFDPAYGAPYNYAPPNYYQRPDQRYTFGASLKYEINEHFRPYLETMYINKRDSVQIAESGTFFALLPPLDCTDELIGSLCADIGADTSEPINVYVAKRNIEGGPRRTESETSQFRIVAGVEGDLGEGDWTYNASFLFGQTSADIQGFNDFLTDRIVSAILGCPDGSFGGCIPYEVFIPGGVTTEAARALAGVSFNKTVTDLMSVNAYVAGDLGFGLPWAGGDNIKLVMGAEHREETFDFNADTFSQEGNFAGAGGPAVPVNGKTQVSEVFLESAVPLIADAGILESLNLDLGYRLSDYKGSGTADTFKIGFTADLGDYRFRGGYNRAIRAPNINELFAQQQIALFGGQDPCAGVVDTDPDTISPTLTPEQCANTGVPLSRYGTVAANPAGQNNQFIGGNLDLEPEVADTYTIGVVATPIENLQLNLDYFDIKIEDTIGTIGAPTILQFCGLTGDPFLCSRIQRNAGSLDLFRGNDPATAGLVVNVNDNFGEQRFRGLDLGGSYRWEMLNGRFVTNFQGTYILEQEISPLPGVNEEAVYDCAGRINPSCAPTPEWRHIANLRYSLDAFTVNLRWRYFGEVEYREESTDEPLTTDSLVAEDGGIDAQNYIDLSGSVFLGDNTELTIGVNNVFDKEPPLVGVSLALNGNAPGGYDQAGRFIFGSISFKF